MQKVGLDDSFYPYFIDETLILIDSEFKESRHKTLEVLDSKELDASNSVIPDLSKDLLVLIRFHVEGKVLSSYKPLLSKLLAAVGSRFDQSDTVVMNRLDGVKARTIIDKSPASKVISFGVDIKNPENFALRSYNNKQVLIACPIESLQDSKQRKSQLWSLLKEMFEIN